jgi:hypothetical protein
MDVLKKFVSWVVGVIAVIVIAYNFFNGWLITTPQPRVFEQNGQLWVAEPTSTLMHYLFGSETLRKARRNIATGKYEFEKDGRWISVATQK